jgi:chromate transporter
VTTQTPILVNPPDTRKPSLIALLLIFLKIGSIGFGGGMAIISIMERELVQKRRLLSLDEFLHGVGFGQILGSFAVNVSLFVGYRLFGVVGGILSAATFLLPSVALVIALSDLYFRFHSIPALQSAVSGLAPVVIALIVDAAWSIGGRVLHSRAAIAVAGMALVGGVMKINALWLLVGAAAISLLVNRHNWANTKAGNDTNRHRSPLVIVLFSAIGSGSSLGVIGVTFLKMGLLFFGGGFLLVPVLHQHLVTDLHWLTAREFIDGVAISNLTPGPIAVLSTFAGYHLAGILGALIATIALMLPAILLMTAITSQYERIRNDHRAQHLLPGLNPAITGLILSTAVLLGGDALTSWRRSVFAFVCLLILRGLRWPPVILLGAGAVAGYVGLLA